LNAGPNLALVGVVIALALLNSAATAFWPDTGDDYLAVFAWAIFGFEPIAFGVWTALGAGSILKHLPVAVPCLMLLFVAPGYVPNAFADLRQTEFTMAVAMGFAVYAATTLLFLIFRRFTGFRISPSINQAPSDNARIKFGIKDLLALITLYSIVLGLSTQLKFDTKPATNTWILGPDFYIAVILYGGSTLAGAILPTVIVPLSILHGRPSRRAVYSVTALWAAIVLAIALLFDGNPKIELAMFVVFTQLIAATIGAFVAIALRCAGLRLVRSTTMQAKNSISQPPAPNP
jgi:hypothetical protein